VQKKKKRQMNRVKDEKGLENKPGQNNCFLNVVIQSLWHIEELRSLINQIDKHNHNKNCILCSLKVRGLVTIPLIRNNPIILQYSTSCLVLY